MDACFFSYCVMFTALMRESFWLGQGFSRILVAADNSGMSQRFEKWQETIRKLVYSNLSWGGGSQTTKKVSTNLWVPICNFGSSTWALFQ